MGIGNSANVSGNQASIFSGENLHNIVACQEAFAKEDFVNALKDGFLSTDRSLLHDPSFKTDPSGCTATTAIIAKNRIYCANAGDSRTVLGVKGIAKPLSFDHKPQNEGERARICAAGGFVEAGRVNGNLALSRAIGDFEFKRSASLPPEEQIVTVFPDVMEHEISPDDEFLILACDGIWDCMHSQAVVEFVRRGIAEKQDLDFICENIMENCLAPASDVSGIGSDNMTMMIVGILNGKSKEEWYDMIATRVANGEGPVAPVEAAQPKSSADSYNDAGPRGPDPAPYGGLQGLPQLLSERVVTNENGVLVFKSSAAASMLSNLGLIPQMNHDAEDDEEEEDVEIEDGKAGKVEEIGEDEPKSN